MPLTEGNAVEYSAHSAVRLLFMNVPQNDN